MGRWPALPTTAKTDVYPAGPTTVRRTTGGAMAAGPHPEATAPGNLMDTTADARAIPPAEPTVPFPLPDPNRGRRDTSHDRGVRPADARRNAANRCRDIDESGGITPFFEPSQLPEGVVRYPSKAVKPDLKPASPRSHRPFRAERWTARGHEKDTEYSAAVYPVGLAHCAPRQRLSTASAASVAVSNVGGRFLAATTNSPCGEDRRILEHRGAARQFERRSHDRFLGEIDIAAEELRHRFGDGPELSSDLRR
jgi:hypothetical protein